MTAPLSSVPPGFNLAPPVGARGRVQAFLDAIQGVELQLHEARQALLEEVPLHPLVEYLNRLQLGLVRGQVRCLAFLGAGATGHSLGQPPTAADLVVVEVPEDGAELADAVLPPTLAWGPPHAPRARRLFRAPGARSVAFGDHRRPGEPLASLEAALVEVDPVLDALPGAAAWDSEAADAVEAPAEVDGPELHQRVALLACAVLLARHRGTRAALAWVQGGPYPCGPLLPAVVKGSAADAARLREVLGGNR